MNINFTITHELSQEDISDLMVTALEGGINYWCSKVEIHQVPDGIDIEYASDVIGFGGSLLIIEDEEERRILSAPMFKRGVEKYCEVNQIYPDTLIDNHDADTADHIIQYALFNEIVYA